MGVSTIQRATDVHQRYNIPTSITVQVDTREKYPVLFPDNILIPHPEIASKNIMIAVLVENTKLDCGDYRLKEFPECCVIERKGSILEIYKNMMDTNDMVRQAKSFRKLSAVEYPYLMIEASPVETVTPTPELQMPELALHRLAVASAKYGLHLLWLPLKRHDPSVRRKVGTMMIHLMLGCALRPYLDVIPELL